MRKRLTTRPPRIDSGSRSIARDGLIAAFYRNGLTMRECAEMFTLSVPRISEILHRECPEEIRPMHKVPARRHRSRQIAVEI